MIVTPAIARHIQALVRVRGMQPVEIHVCNSCRAGMSCLEGQAVRESGSLLEELICGFGRAIDGEGMSDVARAVAVFFVDGQLEEMGCQSLCLFLGESLLREEKKEKGTTKGLMEM